MPPVERAGTNLGGAEGGGGEAVARFVLRGLLPEPRKGGWWGAVKAGGAGLRAAVLGAPRLGWACYAVLQEGEEQVMQWEDTTG